MLKCDYCCIRPSSLEIVCLKCSPSRSINICFKCSINVNQLREHAKHHPLSTYQVNILFKLFKSIFFLNKVS